MPVTMAKRIFDTVQSGLTSTVLSLKDAVQSQPQGSAFYPTTLDQLENVKSGWLWKQGGIVKSWHRRYFVMKGDYIYYYSSDDDCVGGKPPLGAIFLPGNRVVDVPFSSSDAEKFQFEIQTGDATRMTPSHETYLLSADTEDERKDWIRAIKHCLYSVSGGAIFGQSLEKTLRYEQQFNKSSKVPDIVECCVTYLRQNGLHEEGLFRLPGRSVVIRQLQEMFDRGERPSLTANDPADIVLDIHTVASLLKSYLRELPEPLVPYDVYEQVMTIVTREVPVVGERRAAVKLGDLLADQLSQANYNTLQYVCQFLADVAQCANENKMNVTNLATVFAQCLLCPDAKDDPGLMLATSANRAAASQLMISWCSKIFRVEYTTSGGTIKTADLLGLDTRNSVVESGSLHTDATANCSNQDLLGLDFGARPPLPRHESLSRPKPSARQPANRAGIVEEVQWQREAVLMHENSKQDSASAQRTVPASAQDENLEVAERSVPKDKKEVAVDRPVPVAARRVVRSSSFDGRLSTSSAAGLPVPPPKPNRQRLVTLQSTIDELTTLLKCAVEERDAAVARVTELEAELNRYYGKFGHFD